MLQTLFYLTTALHVSGITSTHLQEHKITVTTASGNHYTVLLSAAIMEELFQIFHDSIRQHFHSCTVHLDTTEYFICPTDAQLDCSKRMLKFT